MTRVDATYGDRIDLDAILAERKQRKVPLSVHLFGQDWPLPGTMPAAVTMRLLRWAEKGWVNEAGDVSPDVGALEQMALLGDIVPAETMDAWCAKGLDTEDIEPVISTIMDLYERRFEARAEGEATAPKGRGHGSSTSSRGGRTSKPTSNGSTASTSRKS